MALPHAHAWEEKGREGKTKNEDYGKNLDYGESSLSWREARPIDWQEWTLWLWRLGLSIYPVPLPNGRTDGKKTFFRWRRFQTRRMTEAEVRRHFPRDRRQNVAIITGVVSGIAVLDCDDAQAEAWVEKHCPLSSWRWRSPRGLKLAYRVTAEVPTKIRLLGESLRLDLLAEHGSTIAPGSIHESGARYTLEGDWTVPKEALPLLPRAISDLLGSQRLIAHKQSGDPGDAPIGALGVPMVERVRRAALYLAQEPPPMEGLRATKTFKMACKLVRGFLLPDETVSEMLMSWSGLPKREVSGHTRGARRRGHDKWGGLLAKVKP